MAVRRQQYIKLENELKRKLYRRMPDYKFSNDMFEGWIKESLKADDVWMDAGCGSNILTVELSEYSANGFGIDYTIHPELLNREKFIQGDLEKQPVKNGSIDLIISNMVVEHLDNPGKVLKEYHRILKPAGSFIFRTTNKYYPTQFFGHLFSKNVKDKIINRIFGVEAHDIFPTVYKINSLSDIRKQLGQNKFNVHRLEAVEDLHMFNRIVFEFSYIFYHIQKLKPFYFLRNNIVCWAKKN
jgi:SAM-dependent methyltransferase